MFPLLHGLLLYDDDLVVVVAVTAIGVNKLLATVNLTGFHQIQDQQQRGQL